MNGITDPNWPSGHPRQLPSSILPSGSGGELKHDEEISTQQNHQQQIKNTEALIFSL
jgi:hypothetical protein